MMRFIKTVAGLHDQPLNQHNLQPGSWVRTGTNGVETSRGVLMGTIVGKPVIVQDVGQPRDLFRQQMKQERQFVLKVNELIN